MALNVPVFFTRLGSSVVFVAIMLTGLLWNEWSFLALISLINFLCLREFFRLMQHIDKESYWPWWMPVNVQIAGFMFVLLTFFMVNHNIEFTSWFLNAGVLMVTFALTFIPAFVLFATLPKRTAWHAAMQSLFGLLYIAMPMCLLIVLRNYHHLLPLFIILLIWTNDTGAYLVGSFLGKTPFSEISPKKTWEGVVGGTILTIAAAIGVGYFYRDSSFLATEGLGIYGFIGLIVSIAGPAGDLFKSKFKRIAGVKDSGNLMPGHGGALDRFDSLLMVTPFVFVVCYIVIYFMN